jgi:hypothetical protein
MVLESVECMAVVVMARILIMKSAHDNTINGNLLT